MQGSIFLCWMGFKPILVYLKLPFRIKAVWCIVSSKSSPLIQRTLKTFPHQKHIRIRQEFKGRGIGVPLPWDIVVAFFFFMIWEDLNKFCTFPVNENKVYLVLWWMNHLPRSSALSFCPRESSTFPESVLGGPVSLTINRNEHARLVTCVRADYLMKGPSPWPSPKSQWICSECNLDCI